MAKELQERKLKLVLNKLESYLKSDKGGSLTQDQLNGIGQLTDDEVLEQFELEKDMEDEIQKQLDSMIIAESPVNTITKKLYFQSNSERSLLSHIQGQMTQA